MPQKILQSSHKDYIHDIAFDHYGRRIATCSGDRTVKIWDLDENGEWTSSTDGSEWKAHNSGVTSLSWGHPEFGQILATSGSDGLAIVWEERAEARGGAAAMATAATEATTDVNMRMGMGMGGVQNHGRWKERAKLSHSKKGLSCVKFAPRHLRLLLATGSADGMVRIYEAVEVTNLTQWLLKTSIKVEPDSSSDLGVTCLDWCTGKSDPPTIVVGGSSGNVNVYRYSDASKNWNLYLQLEGHLNPRRGVLDVSWSPDIGRTYHLVSSCGRDGCLRVHRLKKSSSSEQGNKGQGSALELESSQILDTEGDTWRCAWNVTGTVLASSGDSGVVKLWKSDFKRVWKCVSDVHGTVRDQGAIRMAP